MLRSLPQTKERGLVNRVIAIAVFTVLMILSARVTIGYPVPFTLQTLVVVLSGYVLGARDGAFSQLAYLGLIAVGLPVDAYAVGSAALVGPTAGFLFGFPLAAFIAGYLTERGVNTFWLRFVAGLAGIAVVYVLGAVWFSFIAGRGWDSAWTLAIQPFILIDITKAIVAAGLAEGGRSLIGRL